MEELRRGWARSLSALDSDRNDEYDPGGSTEVARCVVLAAAHARKRGRAKRRGSSSGRCRVNALKTAVTRSVPAAAIDSVRPVLGAALAGGRPPASGSVPLRPWSAWSPSPSASRSTPSRPCAQAQRPARSGAAVKLVGSCAEEVDQIGRAMKRVGHDPAVGERQRRE